MTPFANILHRDALVALVGHRIVERGERYFRDGHVHSLARKDGGLTGTVRGTALYHVRVWVNAEGLAYLCECKHGAEGNFCKHAVALAMAWIAQSERSGPLEARLHALDADARLRVLLRIAEHQAGRSLLEQMLQGLPPR